MSNKVVPIKPGEAAAKKKEIFPDAVFESFNEIILRNLYNGVATFKQDDVVKLMVQKGLKREEIFDKGWLNIEEAYKLAGWKVSYDKPAYCESYPATFKFEEHPLKRER